MPWARTRVEWPAGDRAARTLGATDRAYGSLAQFGLRALELIYRGAVSVRNALYDSGLRRASAAAVPVISVGNIVAGGAGKTPFTRWVVSELTRQGRRPAILHGGYGSDEPALHRAWQPGALVIEQRDRVAAARAAVQQGADIVVLDDAFQHRRLKRDLDIVLVPAETRSTHTLPRGPLREPATALARADIIVITRKTVSLDEARAVARSVTAATGKPCGIAALLPGLLRNAAGAPVFPAVGAVLVAAIARPDLLLQQLTTGGTDVVIMLAYPDHHVYSEADARYIMRTAADRPIITTEKDAAKLLAFVAPAQVWIQEQRLDIEEGHDLLADALRRLP